MFRYVPFAKIDKNKWNGTIHYSPNGNVYGYYWYLKSVLREWDAIIENDYETVMPIITQPLHVYQYKLLPELGPYSINEINSTRFNALMELAMVKNKSAFYPINQVVSDDLFDKIISGTNSYAEISTLKSYEDLADNYSKEIYNFITMEDKKDLNYVSGIKPEKIVELGKLSNDYKNALMRIMYNCMHRGIGFSNSITSKRTKNILASSYYVMTPHTHHEIFSYNQPASRYKSLNIDLVLRKNANKPVKIRSYNDIELLMEMGFSSGENLNVNLRQDKWTGLKKLIGAAH